MKQLIILFLLIFILQMTYGGGKKHEKYTREANLPDEKYDPDFREIKRPFRMAKLNLVWTKAQHRLTEPKLKSLYTDLKIQDKEEIEWKQLNVQHKDKEGLKEAELRKKLIGIMTNYNLLEYFDETQDYEKTKAFKTPTIDEKYRNKSLFKDKKLNKLWEKAELSGFSTEEMNALKEEFSHHQEKIDLYYKLLENLDDIKDGRHENAINEDEHDKFNEILKVEETPIEDKATSHVDKVNLVREKHRDIRDNFDILERKTSKGPNSQDFVEPKVQGLWRVALSSEFSADELNSLKIELLHYESRLLKLRHMHAEHALAKEKYKKSDYDNKHDKMSSMEENIKKQTRKVEKIQAEVERKIFDRTEL